MEIFFASRKPKKCPACGVSPVSSILRGTVNMTPELEEKLRKGTWSLGGCCEEIPSATWQCTVCETDIYHERDRGIIENTTLKEI